MIILVYFGGISPYAPTCVRKSNSEYAIGVAPSSMAVCARL